MTHPSQPPKRLTRSRDDKVIAGVCGGFARYVNLDPALVRILFVVLTLLTSGAAALVYLVALLVMPEQDRVGPPPPPVRPRPPAWPPQPPNVAPGPRAADPVWGREGAPWEQPQASTRTPAGPPAPATAAPDPDGWPQAGSDPGRPDAR